ncbi:MAG: hypothetical protein K6F14_07035 [Clostridiales bacterium]|nr:hypothetical protein [Clostridiales bacterium]
MLYKKNSAKVLDDNLFKNPTSEYRGAPFWAWNCELNQKLLDKQIDDLKDMGFGGFHMHSRVGMATDYLSEDFMNLVKGCVKKAKENEMLAWLYDEDRWPSGSAGGKVTKDRSKVQKILYVTKNPYNDGLLVLDEDKAVSRDDVPETEYYFISAYDIVFDNSKRMVSYRQIPISEKAKGIKYFAYCEYSTPTPWYNGSSYVDTFQKKYIEDFIKLTHEEYKKAVGEEFGKAVPAIFTDEPQVRKQTILNDSIDNRGVTLPFTPDFEETFKKAYGESFYEHLPEVIWDRADTKYSKYRYWFHDHVAERFVTGFNDTVGNWCKENGILATGHMMEEPTLESQTGALGEAMRQYRSYQIPGIDLLCDRREYTTAKQTSSVAHQYGREGVMSELYGVTGWQFDFRGHKLQGDWQAALGITVRVPHLFWVSMGGEAKRDYPACIGYQSPWYKEYKYVEDHFARVNTLMTRGKPFVKIGVIHPIESYWLRFGPNDTCGLEIDDIETRFKNITEWMLFGTYDFDFISESLLKDQYRETDSGFAVEQMTYDVVVVPYLLTMRKTTLDALKKFRAKGGKVIFMGAAPACVDACESDEASKFASECTMIPWSRNELYTQLEPYRTMEIRSTDGKLSDNLFYQIRKDGDGYNVFICHVNAPGEYDVSTTEEYKITFEGEFALTEYDSLTGEIRKAGAEYVNGKTIFSWECGADSSILLRLEKGRGEVVQKKEDVRYDIERLESCVDYELTEPNVYPLDFCRYSLNGSEYSEEQYFIHADDNIRDALCLPRRGGKMCQPWFQPLDKNPKEKVRLKYVIHSEISYKGAELALESIDYATVTFNGEKVDMTQTGYYVDEEAIRKIRLPEIKAGDNELVVEYRYGLVTQIEAMFVLGDFGVNSFGAYNVIVPKHEKLAYDDICSQGLPFYGGNIIYKTKFTGGGHKMVRINKYRGAVLRVTVDREDKGLIAYPPYIIDLGELGEGEHSLEVTFYGNRFNTFGAIHNANQEGFLSAPGSWRSSFRSTGYSRAYLKKKTGLLVEPQIFTEIR